MNLVKQFRAFGKLTEEQPLPMDAQVLYYNLMQLFNKNMWPAQLEIETYRLEDNCQMTRKRIGQCRDILLQKGLIKYQKSKMASGSPKYSMVFLYETQNDKSVFRGETQKPPTVFPRETQETGAVFPQETQNETPCVSPGNTFNKTLKTNKTTYTTVVVSADAATPKKTKSEKRKAEIEATPFWKKLVDVWFVFYTEKFFEPPSFKGEDPRHLKHICDNLQKRALGRNFEWSEEKAADTLQAFLQFAYTDKWLKENFLLQNLYKQFDKIITNGKQQGIGKQQSVASAFSKINAVTGSAGGK